MTPRWDPNPPWKEMPKYWHNNSIFGSIVMIVVLLIMPALLMYGGMWIGVLFGFVELHIWQIFVMTILGLITTVISLALLEYIVNSGFSEISLYLVGQFVVYMLCLSFFVSVGISLTASMATAFTIITVISNCLIMWALITTEDGGIKLHNWYFIMRGSHELQANVSNIEEQLKWSHANIAGMWYCEIDMGLWCFMKYDDMVMFKLVHGGI